MSDAAPNGPLHFNSKLTPQLISDLVKLIRTGNTLTNACLCVGINIATYYLWKKRAEKGETQYCVVIEAVTRAKAEGNRNLRGIMLAHALGSKKMGLKSDWRAADRMLEATDTDWQSKHRLEVSGPGGSSLVMQHAHGLLALNENPQASALISQLAELQAQALLADAIDVSPKAALTAHKARTAQIPAPDTVARTRAHEGAGDSAPQGSTPHPDGDSAPRCPDMATGDNTPGDYTPEGRTPQLPGEYESHQLGDVFDTAGDSTPGDNTPLPDCEPDRWSDLDDD